MSSHQRANLSKNVDDNWWLKLSDHLGGVYPFYDIEDPTFFSLEIGEIIKRRTERSSPVVFDVNGVVCKVVKSYLLGDRTLVKGIRRVPWMSHYSPENNTWLPVELPPHGHDRPNPEQFVPKLKAALLSELMGYVGEADSVGILLSGGMDSRVVAGVLRENQLAADKPMHVTAITWGNAESRDVIYASKIADRFGWTVQHLPLNAQTLLENIETAGLAGAEVSALHLHAMPKVAELKGIDVVLAGSYGDSVGRAEFSGRKVTNLKSVLPGRVDPFGVLRQTVIRSTMPFLRDDCASPHLSTVVDRVRLHEIEQEMHYMRRMLQSCMLTIAKKIPLYQMFTAPEVFGLMWGLDPEVRDNSWYRCLLESLPGDLLNIPWARTGRLYEKVSSQTPDNHSKRYHAYGIWLRKDLCELIEDRVNSKQIRGFGIFNNTGLDNALNAWGKATTCSTNALDELMCWLASLHVFLNHYDVKVDAAPYTPSVRDSLSLIKGRIYGQLFVHARNFMRE